MKIDELLRENIESELEDLKDLEIGTEEYKTAVDGVTKLMDRAIEMDKIQRDSNDQKMRDLNEQALKREELAENRRGRIVKNVIDVASFVIPVGVTIWGTLASFKFEKEGTITTIMGRGFINKLLPKK